MTTSDDTDRGGQDLDEHSEFAKLPETQAEIRGRMAQVGPPTPPTPSAEPPSGNRPASWRDPERIGPYRIVDRLGSGGMGVVYLAEQEEPVRRQVALKLVRADLTNWQANVRFAAEQQALAKLSHPNIARLYGSGETPERFPYFVMEYIPGVPITLYCDRERLSLEARLELFITVCQGVQHAHQNGILHRDIKPSNVLVTEVDSRPAPKIIDFGIAKGVDQPLGDESQLTGGAIVGTLAYISPEAISAARGEINLDTRSDVYALGVLLHELLVGGRPHDTGRESPAKLLESLATGEVPRITDRFEHLEAAEQERIAAERRLSRHEMERELRGDLEWIVARAVARERDDRYSSPGEFAADVQRHLDDLPVVASPPSLAYRSRKFVRRHRVGVTAGVAVVVALIAGVAGTTAAMLRAQRAEGEAAHQAEVAGSEAAAAKQARDESESVLGFVIGIFKASQPGETRGELIPVGEVLARGADKIQTQLADQPAVRARLMRTIGEIYHSLGADPRALELLNQALALQEEILEPDDPEIATTLQFIGITHTAEGNYREALDIQERCLAIRERSLPPNDPAFAGTYRALASVLTPLGRIEEAVEYSRRAVAVLEATKGPEHLETGKALAGLATELSDLGHYDEAIATFERSRPIFEKEVGKEHQLIGGLHNNVGLLYIRLDDPARAEEHFRQALSIWQEAAGPDHPYTFMALSNLASAAASRRQIAEVEAIALDALPRMTTALGPTHPTVKVLRQFLGNAYAEAHRHTEAEPHLEALLDLALNSTQQIPADIAAALENLGALRVRQERFAEAESLLQRSLAILEEGGDTDSASVGFCYYNLGDNAWRQGRFEQAKELLTRGLEIFEAKLRTESPRTAGARLRLARAERDLGNREVALQLLRRAAEVHQHWLPGYAEEFAEEQETIARLAPKSTS